MKGRPLHYGSVMVALAVCFTTGCSRQTYPNILDDQKGTLRYVYSHCQNGTAIRTFGEAAAADYAVSADEKGDAESIRYDKELVICSREADDKWLEQVTNLMYLGDRAIDLNKCKIDEPNADESSRPANLIKSDWANWHNCLALSAYERQREIQAIGKSSDLTSIRRASKGFSDGAAYYVKSDNTASNLP